MPEHQAARHDEVGQLRAAEARYRTLVENARIVLVEISPRGEILYANRTFYEVLGYPAGSWLGRSMFELVHPDDGDALRRCVASVVARPARTTVPILRARTRWGEWRLVEGTVDNLTAMPGVHLLVAAFLDVTEREHSTERLRIQAALLDAAGEAVVATDLDGRITYLNRAAQGIYGWRADEVLGTSAIDLAAEPMELPQHDLAASIARGESWTGEMNARRRDGSSFPARVTTAPVGDATGRPVGAVTVVRDVTEERKATDDLAAREERFRALIDHASDVVLIVDEAGTVSYVSPSAQALFGYRPEALVGTEGVALVHPDDLPEREEAFSRIREPGASTRAQYRVVASDGSWRHVDFVLTNLLHVPTVRGYVLNARDVTARAEAEAELLRSREALAVAQRLSATGSWDDDLRSGVAQWSDELYGILGLSRGLMQPSFPALVAAAHPEDRGVLADVRARALDQPGPHNFRFRATTHHGQVRTMQASIEATRGPDGVPYRLIGAVQDVTEFEVLQGELQRQSLYDTLTNLPNRTLFLDRLDHSLRRRTTRGGEVAVLLVDIDGFREVNDRLGYPAGDDVLVSLADRFERLVRASDTVARIGGDGFGILLDRTAPGTAEALAGRVLAAVHLPVRTAGRDVLVRASVGIANGRDGAGPEDLLRDAEHALNAGREARRRRPSGIRHHVYDVALHEAWRRRALLRESLEGAVERDEFAVFYQPIVRLKDGGRTVGVEALLRWNLPDLGIVAPGEFIPLAEETGAIVEIGDWVLRQSTRWIQRINETRERPFNLAVNLSPRQLTDPGVVLRLGRALEHSGLDPHRLVLEITEHVLVDDSTAVVPTLESFRKMGVRIGVDDFGTGYSSLASLRRLPLDVLKIDRSFVLGVTTSTADAVVARTIVRLAEALDLATVAEGIETAEQARVLTEMGSGYGQGYLFGRPQPADTIEEVLRAT